jgi:hypothetical protein
MYFALFDGQPQDASLPGKMLLPDKFVEAPGSYSFG